MTDRFRPSRVAIAAAVLLLLSGCDLVDKLKDNSPVAPTPVTPPTGTQPVTYAALGASDAVGVGSSVACTPLTDCPNGMGYVYVLTRRLRETREVKLTALGLPAGVLSPGIQALGNQYGRDIPGNFIEREMPFVPSGANLITVFAGANDTNAVGAAIKGGAAGSDVKGYIDTQVRNFGNDYRTLLRGLRTRAPGAYILLMNVPNMAGLPYAQRYTTLERQVLQQISVGFSRETNGLATQGVGVVDLMCDAPIYDPSRFSSDGFHPNDAGYAHMADLLQNAINAGGPPPPPPGCGQMQLLPPL